ncbi:hypothetical protein FHETE_2271 [Fusarium heterosporum]|uniref:Uncharacterized protein n=1 Tax=Fusarium heterosporum TaxID=42747 RepID=A0A8H5WZW8_FUSHE|nr:hypothetical protein FHETE_2271 [Fusarium heterosporum]
MGILVIIWYFLHYGWQMIKFFPRALKGVFQIILPLTIFTIIVSAIQGLVVGFWSTGTQIENPRWFVKNIVTFEIYEWLKEPGGRNLLRIPRAPYHIQRLYNPLDWTKEVGIVRPRGWSTNSYGLLASLEDLHRIRRYSGDPGWHHWIYLSANDEPLNDTWNADPWDKAFLDLLEHRDKYELQGRANFNYITCPKSYLCRHWSISGPALIHFTNEPVQRDATEEISLEPILDPVSVRVFQLPLEQPVIPGIFPSQFEQMRSITASNSTYWETRDKYSDLEQVRGQSLEVLKKMEDEYPLTYGMLVWLEDKWVSYWDLDDSLLVALCRFLSYLPAAQLGHYVRTTWHSLYLWWNNGFDVQLRKDIGTLLTLDPIADDPVERQLQYSLSRLKEEDKEKFGNLYLDEMISARVQDALKRKDW